MKYLKVWTDFADVLETLEDAEVGRLFIAMLRYASTGEEPPRFEGNERFIWPVARRDIDKTAEEAERLTENGRKGGRPKTNANQQKPTQTNANQHEPTQTQKEKKGKEIEKKGKETDFIDAADAQEILKDHDRVLDAAEDAGFKMTNNVRASLIALYAENGLEKVLAGLRSCSEHGAVNLAYLRACMKDEPRPMKANVPAQAYTQRDYDGEQKDAMMRMLRAVK